MEAQLWEAIGRLAPLEPDFVSVTYGAGGSTRERTHATVARLVERDRAQTRRASDLRRRVAGRDRRRRARLLRRRRPPHRRAARRSARRARRALCRAARRLPDDRRSRRARSRRPAISRSRSPPIRRSIRKARRLLHDVEALKRKVDAGADRAITQFFFDNCVYFRFLDVAAAAGIDDPDRAGHRAGAEFQADRQFRPPRRRQRAGLARRAFRGARGRSDDAPPRRGGGLRRAGARPHRPRRRRICTSTR